jgi:hypothetical protein
MIKSAGIDFLNRPENLILVGMSWRAYSALRAALWSGEQRELYTGETLVDIN